MVYVNSSGVTELFMGAYSKRVEQNKNKASAQADRAEGKNGMTAKEYLGSSVEISEESKEFMAGVAERKAAQIAERDATRAAEGGNAFNGTGDFKQQYLVLSENLYNNGFYDKLSDDEVRDMEQMLKDITSGMESINGLNRNFSTDMSHEAAKLELISSVNALNYFADKYVPEEMKDSFKEMIKQYESYNSEKVADHKSIYDLRDESMAAMPAPNMVNISTAAKKTQEDTKASMEIGRVKHTKEQEQENKIEYQALFDNLMQKRQSVSNIFSSLQNILVNYASGGSKNSNVLALLNSRNVAAIHNMSDYWSKLL